MSSRRIVVLTEPHQWPPLVPDHPLITEGSRCALCTGPFWVGKRPAAIEDPEGEHDGLTRASLPVHETCVFSGVLLGVIDDDLPLERG